MSCLWGFLKWPKQNRRKKTGRRSSSENLERVNLLPWDNTQKSEVQGRKLPDLEERYVRFGIGGAGNMRKCDPLLY